MFSCLLLPCTNYSGKIELVLLMRTKLFHEVISLKVSSVGAMLVQCGKYTRYKIKIQVSSWLNWIFFRKQWKLVDNLVDFYICYHAQELLHWHTTYKFMFFDIIMIYCHFSLLMSVCGYLRHPIKSRQYDSSIIISISTIPGSYMNTSKVVKP